MRRLNLRAFLAGGSALLLVTAGAGASWGFASQPPSDEVEAEEAGEETTGGVVEADVIEGEEGEEDAARAPGTTAPQAAGGTGATLPTSPASAEDPPLGSSGDGGTGGNGRPTQDPDKRPGSRLR